MAVAENPLYRLVVRVLRRLRYPFVRSVAANAPIQDSDGTFQVQPDDANYPATTGVTACLGIPGATCKATGRVLLSYADADPGNVCITSWGASTLTELKIANGSQGVARVGDTVDCGYLAITPGVSGVSAVAWLPPGTLPLPTPPVLVIPLTGRISSGSSIVKVG